METEVHSRIPSVVVRAEDAGGADLIAAARLTIDGAAHPLDGHPVQLDPGTHALRLQTDRGAQMDQTVLLVEGNASRVVTLRRASASPAAPAPGAADAATSSNLARVPRGAWILGAAYFALAAASDLDRLRSTCAPPCSDAQAQPGRADALLCDALLGVGGAAVGGALVWAIAFPSRRDAGGDRAPPGRSPGPGWRDARRSASLLASRVLWPGFRGRA